MLIKGKVKATVSFEVEIPVEFEQEVETSLLDIRLEEKIKNDAGTEHLRWFIRGVESWDFGTKCDVMESDVTDIDIDDELKSSLKSYEDERFKQEELEMKQDEEDWKKFIGE